ncbi:hypothetical protein P43SY_010344 [Pythium insidiosum]|uniref:DDE Tnp4 domain-containing protein n=1 Tax=Pythium insidiosum TaxID=114742 RepID=A0AAD5Q5C4_PYTIN|nr:hypothetical protein P43SY_010344 [Pythium insidiosum]
MEQEPCFTGKVIYGDGGYGVSDFVCAPYHGANPTVYQLALNTLMSTKRLTVEWLFKDVKTQWSHVNWHIKMQARKTRAGLKFSTAMLLTNIHTCLYGSQTARYFNCPPPSLEEYLSG